MKRVITNLGLTLCLVFAVVLIGCAGSRTETSTGEMVDDSVITTKVKSLLVADQGLSAFDIEVETFKGVVQLSGFVDTEEQAEKAAEIAESVEGVRDVKNSLIVKGEQ
ncbi:MAG TPA: BON domain-containing protein [Thermodesulfobacteriota bacterium]|nr:BON domain-containing protein [Thermodesulfobacteriota bacterium]